MARSIRIRAIELRLAEDSVDRVDDFAKRKNANATANGSSRYRGTKTVGDSLVTLVSSTDWMTNA